ncbi:ras small GTPase RAC1 [Coemansia sp. RSA 552]|nr:ras small GTPase RAC1 [Coemansia sp. RSA 552]
MANGSAPVSRRKAVVIGDGACGKTCLLHVFRVGRFPEDNRYIPTIFDTWVADMEVDSQPIELALWDTAGQEDFDRLRFLCYPDANVVIICFSVDQPDSLVNVFEKWHPEIQQNAPRAPVILVALKLDLRDSAEVMEELRQYDEHPVTYDEGKRMARRIGAVSYVECSSIDNVNVRQVFEIAARRALNATDIDDDLKKNSGHCQVELSLWDTAGQEDYDRLRIMAYPDTDVILVCFSVDLVESLTNVFEKWLPEVREMASRAKVMLVALKIDLRTDPDASAYIRRVYQRDPISYEEGKHMARAMGIPYIECSAKRNQHVTDVFAHALQMVVDDDVFERSRSCCVLL